MLSLSPDRTKYLFWLLFSPKDTADTGTTRDENVQLCCS